MGLYTDEEWLESKEFPFFSALYAFEDGEYKEPHSHEFIEFVYVTQGTGTHYYQGFSYPIARGDVFVIEPNAEHSYMANRDKLAVYNVLFQPSLIAAELETLASFVSFIDFFYVEPFMRRYADFQSHLVLDVNQHLEIVFLLDRLLNEFNRKRLGYRVLVKTQLIELFVLLSRCHEENNKQSLPGLSSHEAIIRRVCQFIELHHAQPLTLQQVSQLCGMSQTEFSRLFKRHVGQTFIEFRNRIRLDAARELLRTSGEKILTISERVGFEDLSFFNKLFKLREGVTPRQYRAERARQRRPEGV